MNAKSTDKDDNAGIENGGVIRMDASRSKRLQRELWTLENEITSLATAASTFPKVELDEGDMDPLLTVRVFTTSMKERVFLLLAMANYEEHVTDGLQEEGGT